MKYPRIILGCLISIMLVTTASADWVALTDNIPLSSLEGESLIVGDKVFSNFFIDVNDVDLGLISVRGVQDVDSGDYGLRFNEFSWFVSSNESITVELSFKVSILPDPEYEDFFMKDIWLYLTGAGIAGTGSIIAGENVWDDFPSDDPVAQLSCHMFDGDTKLVDSAEFAPLKEIYIQTKYIHLNGGSSGIAYFDEFFQFYGQTQIPEPATIMLLGTAGIWVFTRKNKSIRLT